MTMKKFLISAFIIVISLVFTISSTDAARKNKNLIRKKHIATKTVTHKKHRSSEQRIQRVSRDPYLGAVVIDAATGEVLFDDNANAKGYPASMVKMMNLLVILEAVEAKQISLHDKVTVTPEVASVGGSRAFLKTGDVYTVDDLLYALMVKSANDAAMALALHYKGNREDFVALMNKRAREIGMKDTAFRSVHGLPGKGYRPDVSTPLDITKLCREVLKHPQALQYTSTTKHLLRANTRRALVMRNHNHLVGNFEGCDGLKTGYFRAAGFSIAATASNEDGRAIAVVFGSVNRNVRDAKARELLAESLTKIAAGSSLRRASIEREAAVVLNR